jgi:spore maturation protein A
MINILWTLFIIVGIVYSLFTGNITSVNNEILNSARTSLAMILNMLPIITLWVGIMGIAKTSGLLDKIAHFFSPILSLIFPDIPACHESLGFISSNIIANLFGLGNAATPFGIKAMESLQTLNNKKDTATRSMITFLILNTTGLSLIPTTIISLRMMHNSANPLEIVGVVIIVTLTTTICGLIIDKIVGRRYK